MTTTAQPLTRAERRIFEVSVALIALHVLDDAFLQPQPGTSAGDHLAGGLIPLALLAAAAIAFPRMRSGARAVTALLAGLFGIAAAIEGVYYATATGPSGDDFTGLLAIPAALALLGLAGATLWRTRRRDGGVPRTLLRRSVLVIGAVVFAVLIVRPVGFAYVTTHTARAPVDDIDLGARPVEDVSFITSDGLELEGSYVPSTNGAAVIVGFGRKSTQRPARMLARHGYGVLVFDRRGEGESEGDPNLLGWSDAAKDVHAAVGFLKRRPDVVPGRIGGLGLSVGGESMLHAAARSADLEAVVSEGAGSRSAGEHHSLPGAGTASVVAMLPQTLATAVFANSAPPPHLIDLVPDIGPRAVFLIHSADAIERLANRSFYAAATGPKALWQISEGGHVGGLEARPREYEQRVIRFFDRSLQPRQPEIP